jgi:uncharacterized membrane protein YheB (UPF0754 family)
VENVVNKSVVTNGLALIVTVLGLVLKQDMLLTIGLFALSGAITNWLAVHMLFEKIPGLYGSGVIPARFEDFKQGIRQLMMEQFFTAQNIDRFLSDNAGHAASFDLAPVIDQVDLSPTFNSLVEVIETSSFGGMLAMVGGAQALQPLQQPFIEKMQQSILAISQTEQFRELMRAQLEQPAVIANMQDKVSAIIEQRLAELTPTMVKDIIQTMIRQHLGWLVVWGGVFGALIGFIASFSALL